MPSDYEFDDDDEFDDAALHAIERAEQAHIVATQSQQASSFKAPSRTVSAAPVRKPASVPPQQPARRAAVPLPGPSQVYGNGRAQSVPAAQHRVQKGPPPARPVYKDEVPRPELGERKGGSVQRQKQAEGTSTAAAENAEAARLAAEVEQLRAAIESERRMRTQKEGEVKILRSNVSRKEKDYQSKLDAQTAEISKYQEKLENMERMSRAEKQRYRSELLFAQQEYESAQRNNPKSTARASTAKRSINASQVTRNQGASPSPKKAKSAALEKQQKGFQNSFFEPDGQASQSRATRARERAQPGSSPAGSPSRRLVPAASAPAISPISKRLEKGKGREQSVGAQVQGAGEDSELKMLDSPPSGHHNGRSGRDTSTDEETGESARVQTTSVSKREEFTSTLFGHQPPPYSSFASPATRISSLHLIINHDTWPALAPDQKASAADLSLAHRQACKELFSCLGLPNHATAGEPEQMEQQDRAFLYTLLGAVLSFLPIFEALDLKQRPIEASDTANSDDALPSVDTLIITLYFIQDLLHVFAPLLFHQDSLLQEQKSLLQRLFASLASVVRSVRQRLLSASEAAFEAISAASTKAKNAGEPKPTTSKGALLEMERLKREDGIEPVLLAVLGVYSTLAWRPDENVLNHFDSLLRDGEVMSTFLDPGRQARILSSSLQWLASLACHPILFRTILACPLTRDLPSGPQPPKSGTSQQMVQHLPFIEHICPYITYSKASSLSENVEVNQYALSILATLLTQHQDAVPLIGQLPNLIGRLILRLSYDAEFWYENVEDPFFADGPVKLIDVLDRTDYSIRLLFHLTASEKAPKTIQQHLQERPFYRDAFVSGIGRLAYHEIPEWLADEHLMQRLDMIGAIAMDIVLEVLSPEEVEDLYYLCGGEEGEDESDGTLQDTHRPVGDDTMADEEAMAAQNLDAMDE